MRKIHIAIGVCDIEGSVQDYSVRLGCLPQLVVSNEYALWRTDAINFSIRRVPVQAAGMLRHLGWEDASCRVSAAEKDVNGILWEIFSPEHQAKEIEEIWPSVKS